MFLLELVLKELLIYGDNREKQIGNICSRFYLIAVQKKVQLINERWIIINRNIFNN